MSQLIACQSPELLILGADRRVELRDDGEPEVSFQQKLFPLGPRAVVATSGAALGVEVSRRLSLMFERRAPELDDLVSFALSVFQREYSDFIRRGAAWFTAHPEAYRLSYLLFGGARADGSLEARFFGSERHEEPYRAIDIGQVLTAPRRLGVEMKLVATAATAPTDALRDTVVAALRRIEAGDDRVGGGFDLALLRTDSLELERIPPPTPT